MENFEQMVEIKLFPQVAGVFATCQTKAHHSGEPANQVNQSPYVSKVVRRQIRHNQGDVNIAELEHDSDE